MALQHLKKMFILTQFRKVGQDGSQFYIFVYPTLVCCLLFDMFMSAFSIHNTLLLFLLYRVNHVFDSVNCVQCVLLPGWFGNNDETGLVLSFNCPFKVYSTVLYTVRCVLLPGWLGNNDVTGLVILLSSHGVGGPAREPAIVLVTKHRLHKLLPCTHT